MNNPELYKRTVDILFDAYFKDTLQHGYCSACAVGNLISSANQWKPQRNSNWFMKSDGNETFAEWMNVFLLGSIRHAKAYDGEAKRQIDSTGYTLKELMLIEGAFERSKCGNSKEDRMFNGLVAVLEVLEEIHGVEPTTATQSKERFATHYATLTA